MSERLAVDFAWDGPAPDAIRAAGYEGVVRYISRTADKELHPAERVALHRAGLWVALVWETTARRAGAGLRAGEQDALFAEARCDALGYPADAVVFYAVDYNAAPDEVAPYFAGVAGRARRPIGVYGGLRVVQELRGRGIPYAWQTAAWSGGYVWHEANMFQRNQHTTRLAGDFDENIVLNDFPRWAPEANDMTPAEQAMLREIRDAVRNKWGSTVSDDMHGAFQAVLDQRIRPIEEALARIEQALKSRPS